jgi:REP element-mobilizing transposase RayT
VSEFRAYRRNLPHLESPGSVYFVTSNTCPGIILSEDARDIVFGSIRYWSRKKLDLYGAVVMPDHMHIVLQPLEKSPNSFYSLAEILHSVKSYSANKVNQVLGRTGPLWRDENFDRIVRDEHELQEKMEYVMNNPVRAGLVEFIDDYKWLCLKGVFKEHRQDVCGTTVETCFI